MSKLNFSNVSFHQGDVQFFGLTELPSDVKKVQKQFIAASREIRRVSNCFIWKL
jgi:hypothetical protein